VTFVTALGKNVSRGAIQASWLPPPGAPKRGSTREHVPSLGKIGVFERFEPVHKKISTREHVPEPGKTE